MTSKFFLIFILCSLQQLQGLAPAAASSSENYAFWAQMSEAIIFLVNEKGLPFLTPPCFWPVTNISVHSYSLINPLNSLKKVVPWTAGSSPDSFIWPFVTGPDTWWETQLCCFISVKCLSPRRIQEHFTNSNYKQPAPRECSLLQAARWRPTKPATMGQCRGRVHSSQRPEPNPYCHKKYPMNFLCCTEQTDSQSW